MGGSDTCGSHWGLAILLLALGVPMGLAPGAMQAQQSLLPEAPLTAVPAASLTKLDAAPKPAQVTCEHGMMTIEAENSTLGSILAGVQTCLGVRIDVPPESAAERFYIKSGPASVRAKLDEVLSETGLNYVIEEGPSLPYRVQSVMLMSRSVDVDDPKALKEGTLGHAMTPARRAWLASQEAARDGRTADADNPGPDAQPTADRPSEDVPADVKPATTADPRIEGPKSDRTGPDEDKAAKDTLFGQLALPAARLEGGVATTPSSDVAPAVVDGDNAPAVPSAATPVEAQQSPPQALDPSADPKPAGNPAQSEFQNKVDQMQKMFEERKTMTSTSAPPVAPN